MNRNWRMFVYGIVGATVLIAALAAPAAWATPGQNWVNQSIPTRTPTSAPLPPTEAPPPTPVPPTAAPPGGGPTAAPVEPTQPPAGPGATPQPVATPAAPVGGAPGALSAACPGGSALTLVADRQAVWPGATVVFTATLTNTGRQQLKAIVLEDRLAAGLEPGAVLAGDGTWQDRTLRVTAPALDPGARLRVVYSARVTATGPDQAIVAQASAATAGCPVRTATAALGMPPSELPATGASLP
jgi:uncharacterized repeat protein (TIGR01451 family)